MHSVCTVLKIQRQTFIEIHFRTKSTTKINVCNSVNFERNSVKSDRIVSVPKLKPTDAVNSVNDHAGCYVVSNFEFICSLAALNTTFLDTLCLYFVVFSGLCSHGDMQQYGKEPGNTERHMKLTKLSGVFAYETVITLVTAL